MATVELQSLTAEQFRRLPDPGHSTELVRGRIVDMPSPGARHGWICNRIGRVVGNFVEEHDLGFVCNNDSGVVTERDPDTVRGPDVAYYSYARIPKSRGLPDGYPAEAPELVFKVLSPSDSWKRVLARVAELLNAGVQIVVVVDPAAEQATLYYPDRPAETRSDVEHLEFPEILPGLAIPVRNLFA